MPCLENDCKLVAPLWVPCLLARPRNLPQQHISKRFAFPGNNISGTNSFHVNERPHHPGPKPPDPRVERNSHRKNVFVGPPFVGPKKERFAHGFQRNFINQLVFHFFILLREIFGCATCNAPEND